MQIASCKVALNGDITFTVVKPNVTVAEIALLRAIHGPDSVRDIEPLGMDRRSHADERDRLLKEYGAAKDHDDRAIFTQIFPGMSPLPVEFKDIGVEIAEPEPEKVRRGRPPALQESATE
jgi:hypothetical protein